MQILYLIRHTTPHIAPGICYGQLDIGLSENFGVEANRISGWLPPIDLVITSPLSRTRLLADSLAQAHHCELRSDARLMETHFGAWEGKAWDDITRGEIDAWAADVMGYAPDGGESAQQLMARTQTFLRDAARLPQRQIALVAHGGTLRAILAQIGDIPLADT